LRDGLISRGLRGVKFIASDHHGGIKAARKAFFYGVPWQRCQFHLQHNAQAYVSKIIRGCRCKTKHAKPSPPQPTTQISA